MEPNLGRKLRKAACQRRIGQTARQEENSIAALIPVPFIVRNAKRLKAIKERLTFVEGEIAKLDAALGRGVAEI